MNSRILDYTALVITVIGAVNWGLIGLFRFNLVTFLFGDMTWISRIIYTLVGICGPVSYTHLNRHNMVNLYPVTPVVIDDLKLVQQHW